MFTLGVVFALASAAVWGAGDFAGGMASRRNHQFQVVAWSAASGMVVLLICWALWREPLPTSEAFVWAVLAGASGVLGIAALYHGLSLGNAALVAPTAGVVGAFLPVAYGLVTDTWPSNRQLAGFACAIGGIWLVAQSTAATGVSMRGFRVAILAGLGLGGFLVLIAQVPKQLVFGPLSVARFVAFACSLLVVHARGLRLPLAWSNPLALVSGILDAGGTVFYAFARQYARLDVAAVLSSLYPVATVLLARLLAREQVAVGQWVGIALCLTAVALIAG
jgi:drug/metabolite transporter (DMT)-like permease